MRIHGGEKHDIGLDMSVSVNPFGMPPECRKAVIRAVDDAVRYPDTECRQFKEELSRRNFGHGIILGNGACELIYAICHHMSKKHKEYTALTVAPSFMEYEYAIKASNGWVRVYSTVEDMAFSVTEDICAYVDTDVQLVFLCNPNNPTGELIDRRLIEMLADKCAVADTILVVDECFLRFSGQYASHTMTACLDKYPNVVVLDDFSKFYGMAGLRLGYGVCSNKELLAAIRRQMQPWNIAVTAMEAGMAALSDTAYEEETIRFMARERRELIEGLKERGFEIVGQPAANFVLFRGSEGLRDKLNEHGIDIRDCSDMMKYHDTHAHYYRTAVGTREDDIRLLGVLKQTG